MVKKYKHVLVGWLAVVLMVGSTTALGAVALAGSAAGNAVAAADCSAEQEQVDLALQKVEKRVAKFERKDAKLGRTQKAKKQADPGNEKKQAKAKVKKAKKKRAVVLRRVRVAANRYFRAEERLEACEDQGSESPGPTEPTEPTEPPVSPIQELCDAGLPQEVCDAFNDIPLPPGGGTGDGPIQALCDAGLPQPICDAAEGAPLPNGDSAIQPLCDAGLPQAVCDLAELDLPGLPLPEIPGLPLP